MLVVEVALLVQVHGDVFSVFAGFSLHSINQGSNTPDIHPSTMTHPNKYINQSASQFINQSVTNKPKSNQIKK